MHNQANKLRTHFQLNHIYRTFERDKVFTYIKASGTIKINELITGLAGQVHRATVYRALKLFAQYDVIYVHNREIRVSDRFAQHHHTFTCRNCDKCVGFNDQKFEQLVSGLAKDMNIGLEDHQLLLSGLCFRCQQINKVPMRAGIASRVTRLPSRIKIAPSQLRSFVVS